MAIEEISLNMNSVGAMFSLFWHVEIDFEKLSENRSSQPVEIFLELQFALTTEEAEQILGKLQIIFWLITHIRNSASLGDDSGLNSPKHHQKIVFVVPEVLPQTISLPKNFRNSIKKKTRLCV